MRVALTILLVALFIIVAGLALGLFSIDLSAPGGPQFVASGALAYYVCYFEGDCEWVDEGGGSETGWWEFDEQEEMGYPYDPWYSPEYEVLSPYEEPYSWMYVQDASYPYGMSEDVLFAEDWPYYDPWGYPTEPGWGDEWYEPVVVVENPWYVQAFPGIGGMAQRIIPGANILIPPPPPPPIVRPVPPVYPQPSCWISLEPRVILYGNSSTLEWGSFYALRATLSNVGVVPTSGTRRISPVVGDHLFTLRVEGQGGSGSCYTYLTVEPLASSAPSCIISAHPETISRGQTSSLAWAATNASRAELSGEGAVALQGGRYVSPQGSTTYTLSVYSADNRSGACTARVNVLP